MTSMHIDGAESVVCFWKSATGRKIGCCIVWCSYRLRLYKATGYRCHNTWERCVKSHISKCLLFAVYTYPELTTVPCSVNSIYIANFQSERENERRRTDLNAIERVFTWTSPWERWVVGSFWSQSLASDALYNTFRRRNASITYNPKRVWVRNVSDAVHFNTLHFELRVRERWRLGKRVSPAMFGVLCSMHCTTLWIRHHTLKSHLHQEQLNHYSYKYFYWYMIILSPAPHSHTLCTFGSLVRSHHFDIVECFCTICNTM